MTAYGNILTAGYTGDSLRAWKQNGNGRTYFLYDGIVPVVELDSSGTVIAANTHGATGLVSRRISTTSTLYSFDSQGNVSHSTDSASGVLSHHLFSVHGSIVSGSLNGPFGYKAQFGYYTDSETGFQLLTFRYLDSSAGRFITRDPIMYDGGINLYGYVGNNSANSIDPLGLQRLPRVGYANPPSATGCDPCNDPSNWNNRLSDARKIASALGWEVNDGGQWSDNSHLSFNEVAKRLAANGFERFIGNISAEHRGGWDYEGQINGRWYHITVMRPSQSWIELLTGKAHRTKPPPKIDIHCERYYYKPSGIRHIWDSL